MGNVGIHLDRRTGRPLVLHKKRSPGVEDDEPIYSIKSMKSLLDGIKNPGQGLSKSHCRPSTRQPAPVTQLALSAEYRNSDFQRHKLLQAAGNVCHTIGVFA